MPLVQTRGAASAQGFGEFAQAATAVNYIEEVFSCFLYTGTGATQTITNNIDLSTKGGLTWIKGRSGATGHRLTDTARGVTKSLASETTAAEATESTGLTAFGTTGFTIGADADYNTSADTYASWTFREQPKFFDIVTYTGNGTAGRTVAHNLGSVPGCMFVKRTSAAKEWNVYHRSITANGHLELDSTSDKIISAQAWNNTEPTSAVFTVGNDLAVNGSGSTYVAYLFAHDAGGFGLLGTDNVISCGSYVGDGTTRLINIGYEPQWILIKNADSSAAPQANWRIVDNMRGFTATGNSAVLRPNLSDAENNDNPITIASQGFNTNNLRDTGNTYIYIACRRGPMKVPTTGTSVFGLSARSGTGADATVTGGQTDDAVIIKNRGSAVGDLFASRLTGTGYLVTSSSADEVAAGTTILQANPWDVMDGVKVGTTSTITNASSNTFINYLFKRAPSVFDVVCYTGTGSNTTQTHNLGVAPELWIVKGRNAVGEAWNVGSTALAATERILLEFDNAKSTVATMWNSTYPTSTVFSVGTASGSNGSGYRYVAYLFATCAGVSKVGGYTGTGTTKQIDCGFTAGARFVLIKRTDSTGDWYVWDTARGIVAGNDPYLLLNSTAAEVTSTDYIDTYSAGFEISSTAPAAINASAGTFLFLAIA